jgi:hypothetical protein
MADARKHGLLGDFLDAACATPDGRFAAVYERVGTKALLLRDGGILRELNRSYYQAKAYEYAICIWWNGDHRPLIAHCPEEYCRIDIGGCGEWSMPQHGTHAPAERRLGLAPLGQRNVL